MNIVRWFVIRALIGWAASVVMGTQEACRCDVSFNRHL
jgi:uncharacterized membrane protein YeaQ/YmgE (transglycosylase-associated protein family)